LCVKEVSDQQVILNSSEKWIDETILETI